MCEFYKNEPKVRNLPITLEQDMPLSALMPAKADIHSFVNLAP
jgi:hypothetical protein